MHFDTRLWLRSIIVLHCTYCSGQYSDDQSYLSFIEFNRGGASTNLIFTSPHGGFLGANFTSKQDKQSSNNQPLSGTLGQLPIAGCYNNTLQRCVYTVKDCLRPDENDSTKLSYHADARCVTERTSTPAMYLLTKAIADSFADTVRPHTILNKLTRQYVDPAEDLLLGTFLLESAIRSYSDYHRLIAMAKESVRTASRGLLVEFVFHKNSQTVLLGYGLEPTRPGKPIQSTMPELSSRSGSNAITGNSSLGHFLHSNGFEHVLPRDKQMPRQHGYRSSTYSTRMHADQRLNAVLFSYPIERLRTHLIKSEARRIAKAIEQFVRANSIGPLASPLSSSSSLFHVSTILLLILLFFSQSAAVCFVHH